MKRMYRWLSLLLVLAFALALAGCGNRPQEQPEEPTLHIALNVDIPGESLEGLFSPFYARTSDDHTIVDLTQLQLLPSDRAGMPIFQGIEGETRPYNGTDYTYYGPANLEMTQNDDGTVFYDITLRDDLTFSDGELVTVDDLIFSLYVLWPRGRNGWLSPRPLLRSCGDGQGCQRTLRPGILVYCWRITSIGISSK